MRRKWILIGIPCAIVMGFVPFALCAAPDRGLCQQVRSACLNAGFVQGGARGGNGLWRGFGGIVLIPLCRARCHAAKGCRCRASTRVLWRPAGRTIQPLDDLTKRRVFRDPRPQHPEALTM
jgi:hypothetical protein